MRVTSDFSLSHPHAVNIDSCRSRGSDGTVRLSREAQSAAVPPVARYSGSSPSLVRKFPATARLARCSLRLPTHPSRSG